MFLKVKYFQSYLLLLLCCSVGCLSESLINPHNQSHLNDLGNNAEHGIFCVQISSEPNTDSLGICKFSANLKSYKINCLWKKASGKYKCRILLDTNFKQPEISTTIYLFGKAALPLFSTPDDQFDYRTWLISNQFNGTINADDYFCPPDKNKLNLKAFSSNLRGKFLKKFSASRSMHEEGELAGALLLGDRKGIDPSLTQSFIDTGIIHLLAVSGLHVGLVFQVISLVLGFCFKKRKFGIVVIVISLSCLWSYALITGLSASVCRAACMLSMVVIGKGIKRKIPAFNLLSGSAFILIILDPAIILDIGFQLSFSAVFGILAINPILNASKLIQARLIRLILVSTAISIAAQLATLPLTFFYFGRFPVYFLLANFIAIPLASVISYVGFAAIILQTTPYLGDALVWLTLKGIGLLIHFSKLIAGLPSPSIIFQTFEITTCIFLAYITVLILLHSYFSFVLALKSGILLLIMIALFKLSFFDMVPPKPYLVFQAKAKDVRLVLVSSQTSFQSVYLSKNGLCRDSSYNITKQSGAYLAFSYQDYMIACTSDNLVPLARPTSKYVLLIAASQKNEQNEAWIRKIRPNLVIIAPWIYGNQKKMMEEYCQNNKINLWNWRSINKLHLS